MTEKPYSCSQCSKSFHTREGRDEHFKNRHRGKLQRPSETGRFQYKKFIVGDNNE